MSLNPMFLSHLLDLDLQIKDAAIKMLYLKTDDDDCKEMDEKSDSV